MLRFWMLPGYVFGYSQAKQLELPTPSEILPTAQVRVFQPRQKHVLKLRATTAVELVKPLCARERPLLLQFHTASAS